MKSALILTACLFALPAAAQDDAYVDSNTRAILYHELGHALIDLMQIPVLGQEEDAADTLSALLTVWLWEPEAAEALAYDTAFTFFYDSEENEVAFWDTHGPDEQRYFNHICLVYGADPEFFDDFATDLGLPEERAESCEEEYELASDSWSVYLDEILPEDPKGGLIFSAAHTPENTAQQSALTALEQEIADLNGFFSLPFDLTIHFAQCGEANAWYDPQTQDITFCAEFADHLAGQSDG